MDLFFPNKYKKHFNEMFGIKGEQQIYIGLFDGHSGKNASEFCRSQLHVNILHETGYKLFSNDEFIILLLLNTLSSFLTTEDFDAGIKKGLVGGFLKTDSLFNEKAQTLGINDGTTAMALFLREDSIIVANCGDSSGFICRKPYVPISNSLMGIFIFLFLAFISCLFQ